ncbi:hypothetical protein R1flu_018345 [Riccia fluitans]|uniref:Alfin N-terminal domain-containing protein n=1 Tax=Riccia fluitans TaxID=41844 RepID=A0ABD1ZFR9_9MARC
MDNRPSSATREQIFRNIKSRREGIIKALTCDAEQFYVECDPDLDNMCLYGLPDGRWEVDVPEVEVPPDLPEPALGINFCRDGMPMDEWLAFIALHSDAWLIALASFFAADLGRPDKKRLFMMLSDLPTAYDLVTGREADGENPDAGDHDHGGADDHPHHPGNGSGNREPDAEGRVPAVLSDIATIADEMMLEPDTSSTTRRGPPDESVPDTRLPDYRKSIPTKPDGTSADKPMPVSRKSLPTKPEDSWADKPMPGSRKSLPTKPEKECNPQRQEPRWNVTTQSGTLRLNSPLALKKESSRDQLVPKQESGRRIFSRRENTRAFAGQVELQAQYSREKKRALDTETLKALKYLQALRAWKKQQQEKVKLMQEEISFDTYEAASHCRPTDICVRTRSSKLMTTQCYATYAKSMTRETTKGFSGSPVTAAPTGFTETA